VTTTPIQLLVCDGENHAIRLVTFEGSPSAPKSDTCYVASYAGAAAGSGAASGGDVDGALLTASLQYPSGIAMRGALAYFNDQYGFPDKYEYYGRVRLIDTAAGTVSTLPSSTFVGPEFKYPFDTPLGLAITPSGALVHAASGLNPSPSSASSSTASHLVVAIAQKWPHRVIAGSSAKGASDGAGAAASFNSPIGVACDEAGNLVVADTGNGVVRYIPFVPPPPTGYRMTTLVGEGPSKTGSNAVNLNAVFVYPGGLTVDRYGVVFVSDTGNHRIRKVSPNGVVTTFAGGAPHDYSKRPEVTYADGTGAAAMFNSPLRLTVDDSGLVYVPDSKNHRIRMITPIGVVTNLAGGAPHDNSIQPPVTFADGTGTAAMFKNPAGVFIDSSGMVYVADSGNNRIRMITSRGVVTTLAGGAPFDSFKKPPVTFVDGTGTAAMLNNPTDVFVHSSGVVYVADTSNNRIRMINPGREVTTLAGGAPFDRTKQPVMTNADGTGTAAMFYSPAALHVDSNGLVYVTDVQNNCIRTITPGGVVSTVAGAKINYFKQPLITYADGIGTSAVFNQPGDIYVDSSGKIYVCDFSNNAIRILYAM
jgi:sugar lactone lactonase YvrE